MKNIKLNGPVLDLDNNAIPDSNLGVVLASALVQSSTGDALKFLNWAIDLKTKGEITVDQSDFETLKAFVTGNDKLTNLAKGRLLKAFLEPVAPEVTIAKENAA